MVVKIQAKSDLNCLKNPWLRGIAFRNLTTQAIISIRKYVEGKEFCSKIKWKEDYDSRKEHQAENQTCKHFTKETKNLVW
jgi:hypothetical protein